MKKIVSIYSTAILLTSYATSNFGLTTLGQDADMKKKSNTRLMHRIIDSSIIIDASPEEVWSVLVDFSLWETWNDFIPLVEGDFQVGECLRIKVVPPGLKPMTFNPEIYVIKRNEGIVWGGSFLRILYRGDHTFLLEPISGGKTRFRQIERFMGPMVLFMGGMIRKTEVGYKQMNLALKEQVESRK